MFFKASKHQNNDIPLLQTAQPRVAPNFGFTLIELIVVLAIMGVMLGLITVNFAATRADRNLTLAQNELVTNLRKAQSYTLSSRMVAGNQSGQYFIDVFDSGNPTQYSLQSIYNIFATSTTPTMLTVETYQLPAGVFLASPTPVTIYRSVIPLTQTGPCAMVAFKTPFARIYLNGFISYPNTGCRFNNFINDDYINLLNFVINVPNYTTSSDSYAVITLTDSSQTKTRKVMVRGVTGVICPTQDGISCSN